MNIQTKSSILVLSIFIFGIICGFFLHSVLVDNRFQRPPFQREGMDFSKRLQDVLQLTPAQVKTVEPVLKKYDKKMFRTLDNARMQGAEVMDSMKTELQPLLTQRQNEILNDEVYRFKNPPSPMHKPGP